MARAQIVLRLAAVAALVAAAVAVQFTFSNGGGGVELAFAEEAEATTVRIAAQRLEDGRTEFALQVREDDAWSERIEPRANLFQRVEDARVGRWANSSLLELESGHTVRISAKRLDDDRIEFALQEIVDGEPAERILPTRNKFPADPPVKRWLYSTPIELAAAAPEEPAVEEPAVEEPPPPTHIALVNYRGQHAANVKYNSSLNDDGSVTSNVYTTSKEGGDWATDGFGASFAVWCWSSQNLGILLDGLAPQDAESLSVTLTIDGVADSASDWTVEHYVDNGEQLHATLHAPDAVALFERLQSVAQLSAEIDGIGGTHTWNLTDTFTTPIQGNLAECGNYVEGEVQEPLPSTYVPLINASGREGNVRYRSALDDQGQAWTTIDTYADNSALFLRIGCWSGGDHFNVLIDQLPPLATDQVDVFWSVDGGQRVVEQWRVHTFEGSHSYIDSPFPLGMLETLRAASSFAFWVNAPGVRSVTLDLSNTFSTPVQDNIDNCGDYVEGKTREMEHDYVPVTNVHGFSGNASYSAQEHDGRIHSSVTTRSTVTDASAPALELTMACGTELGINIHSLPLIEGDRFPLTIRIDGGPPITMDWSYYGTEQFTAAWPPQTPHDSHSLVAMFRGAKMVTVESPHHWDGAVMFDLDGFFDTPVQENLDNCGMYKADETREIEYDYVPVIGEGRSSATVSYNAFIDSHNGNVGSYVDQRLSVEGARDGNVTFQIACWGGSSPDVKLYGVPATEATAVNVMLQIDSREAIFQTWHAGTTGDGTGYIGSPQPDRLIAQLRGATTVVITIVDSGLPSITINVPAMFDTPIQGNIDNCGRYKRGETRELEQPESPIVSGDTEAPDGESLIVWYTQPIGGDPPWLMLYQYLRADGQFQFYLRMMCGPGGAQVMAFGSRFGELTEGDIQVTWSVDGGPERTETWQVVEAFGRLVVHPVSARATISAWRDGSTLDLTLHTAEPHTQRFHLAELLSTPLQAQVDECLALTPPSLPTPSGEIEQVEEGQLTYDSGTSHGSTVVQTTIGLRIPSDDAPAWAGYSSALYVSCGMGGSAINVGGLGLDRPVFIRGYTVEVTWSVDGGPERTGTWDVWPWAGDRYAISPQDDAAFYAAINSADSLTIKVASDPEFVETYDLAGNGFWDTPVQPNLDACVGS